MATYAAYQQVLLENSSRKDGDSVVLNHNGEGDEWRQGRAPSSEPLSREQASAPAPFCPLSSPGPVGSGEVPPSDLCRPYVTAANVVLSLSHAMQLLNRYCAKLPSDTFTRLTVQWQVHKKLFPTSVVSDRAADSEASVDGSTTQQELYCCIIALPINSPFKDIIVGPWQPSSFLSKHCAAFSACVALHRLGELDDHLLPVGKESIQLEQHLCPPPASDLDPEAFPRPGTTKRRQYYYKKVAVCLTSGCAIATLPFTATEEAVRDSVVGTGGGDTKFSSSSNASYSSEGFFGAHSSNTSDEIVSAVSEKEKLNNTSEECDSAHGSLETKVPQNASSCSAAFSSVVRLYSISMVLRCAIPDQQNTRGRRIYRPELSPRDFGILTTHAIPQTGSFPVFTRSGEVLVSLTPAVTSEESDSLRLSKEQLEDLNAFHQFTFTHVLRLEKYPIKFDPLKANASFFVVPLIVASGESGVARAIDWEFVSNIRGTGNLKPCEPLLDERRQFGFSRERYEDAVVMPWYRNHDQPQYFYVAEICDHLTPQSDFPDAGFETFEKYYLTKYGLQVCNLSQPLLDVDHTSARLNLLTPRHVNRKGVALPTTSEETKRAKRENLQQKQILVPELCSIHPFPASLWRKAVCLPTVLYRINSLLLADELRVKVAKEIGLGMPVLTQDHEWPALDFGWSLADVFKKSQEDEEAAKKVEETHENGNTFKSGFSEMLGKKEHPQKKGPPSSEMDCESPPPTRRKKHGEMEIGTWSNEMAFEPREMADDLDDEDLDELDIFDPNEDLPDNLTILDGGCLVDNVDGELGSDWGTGIKERKSKSRSAGASVGRKRAPPRQAPSEGASGEQGMFRVGSPSNFEYDDGYDFSSGNSSRGDKRSGADGYEGYGDFDDDEDDFDCWDDYEAYSEGEESVAEEGAKHNTSNEWVAKGKKREEEEDESDQEELDLMMGDVECDDLLGLEEQYTNLIEGRKAEILEGLGFIGNDEELKFEKARRPVQDLRRNDYNASREVDTVKDEGGPVISLRESVSHTDANKNSERACVQFGLDFDCIDRHDTLKHLMKSYANREFVLYPVGEDRQLFSFDHQPDLLGHSGPSPSVILQALTMSNANDGVNLERLETIGDSYLKYAITTYLYCMFPQQHEGKLSYLRSKQVSNLNLYRLGKYKGLGEVMVATKFEPHDNWLPPSYYVPRELEEALIASGVPSGHWNMAELPNLHELSSDQIRMLVHERTKMIKSTGVPSDPFSPPSFTAAVDTRNHEELPIFIPYNLLTQHSIPDKSIADSVEALIGAYLTTCGPKGALLFMAWLGIKVLPTKSVFDPSTGREKITFKQVGTPQSPLHMPKMMLPSDLRYTPYFSSSDGSPHTIRNSSVDSNKKSIFSDDSPIACDTSSPSLFADAVQLNSPISLPDPHEDLDLLLKDYDQFERDISYQFLDRGYLLQAFTHASFCRNRLTDCYQRLEFLGDAVLDYLITRHLYEDCRHHSPGALTDLRSALVNNTIFATLAVKHRFHKYFRHFSPGLDAVIRDFVKDQESNGHQINEEYYLLEGEVESDLMEDIEVPKALGDVFESVAGAIFLDSGCSLDAVWSVYFPMMQAAIAQFTAVVPKSPIRELLEMEPETAKFGRPERLVDGKVRVSVEIFGKGSFCGVGRNYRIAKSTAAKRALRHLRRAAPAQV